MDAIAVRHPTASYADGDDGCTSPAVSSDDRTTVHSGRTVVLMLVRGAGWLSHTDDQTGDKESEAKKMRGGGTMGGRDGCFPAGAPSKMLNPGRFVGCSHCAANRGINKSSEPMSTLGTDCPTGAPATGSDVGAIHGVSGYAAQVARLVPRNQFGQGHLCWQFRPDLRRGRKDEVGTRMGMAWRGQCTPTDKWQHKGKQPCHPQMQGAHQQR